MGSEGPVQGAAGRRELQIARRAAWAAVGSNPIRWIEEKGLAASSRRRTRYRTSEGGGAGFMRWKAVRSCVHAPKFAGRARPCATPGVVLGLLKLHEGARACVREARRAAAQMLDVVETHPK